MVNILEQFAQKGSAVLGAGEQAANQPPSDQMMPGQAGPVPGAAEGQAQPQPPAEEQLPPEQQGGEVPPEDQQGEAYNDASEPAPGEQEAYNKVVTAGLNILYANETTQANVVKQLRAGADDPARSLAQFAVMIVNTLDEKSGGQIPEDVIFPASVEFLEELAELANESGAMKVNQNIVDKASQALVYELSKVYQVSEQEVEQFMQSVPEEDQKAAMMYGMSAYDDPGVEENGEPS